MTDDNLGVESAGNPCEAPVTWHERIPYLWISIVVTIALFVALFAMPDELRNRINGIKSPDPTAGLTRAQLWELREVCSYLERR